MSILKIASLLLFSPFVFSQSSDPLCWTKEIDPATNLPYSSHQIWSQDVENWRHQQVPLANIVSLFKAFTVYQKEKQNTLPFGNDKLSHCYIGCRISQETNSKTAIYVGWLKEERDIKDCNLETHFELGDFEATEKGANLGQNKQIDCGTACRSAITLTN